MEHKFNENYKKEIILKMAKHLINTDEYKCVAEEDLKDDLLSNKELDPEGLEGFIQRSNKLMSMIISL